ncbi:hypothetical protein H4582DRAFT_1950840 [Lactarius indigo]|nr:hypothetical protein H4582DRAFT_1950840 [Lactarius indigo]
MTKSRSGVPAPFVWKGLMCLLELSASACHPSHLSQGHPAAAAPSTLSTCSNPPILLLLSPFSLVLRADRMRHDS